ncbi:CBS domain-containing protein [Thermodesulfobacterium sp. TA1]|uniref:transporter associated domain-containing protein n=1 Tax=Thermodesulfobacterium sp. TA1 TaxID=2234087 RepID=UPI001232B2A6|nr:transporter associated domain-containing protein [Thermodesulfobacterium sp. TA1]QER42077.1 CBS domain-containing protein [Thermodesulfobacterium sp. TA1]
MGIDYLSEFLKKIFRIPSRSSKISEIEEDIKEVLEDYKEEKVVSEFEERLFLNLINLKVIEVREIVINRQELIGFDLSYSWEEILEILSRHPFSFYPVYQNVLDHLVGYVSLRDLVRGIKQKTYIWQDWIKKPLIIPETLSLMQAIEKMVEKQEEVAFVVDELSEITGMIRLKDILYEIIKPSPSCPLPDSQGWLLVPGTFKIREIEKCFGIELSKGDFETISGLIIEHLKRIPTSGERILLPSLEVKIIQSDGKKIELLKVRKRDENPAGS